MNNSLTIIGHVGQEPRSVSFANTGNSVVKFSLAVKEFSNHEESTLWIDVDCWNQLGESVMKTVTKGRELALQGRLAINSYTRMVDGVKHEVHKPVLHLTSFHLCGPKPSTTASSAPAVSLVAARNEDGGSTTELTEVAESRKARRARSRNR